MHWYEHKNLRIEARLDLHGLTEAEAHRRLSDFLECAHGEGLRTVLVITGKGREGEGALRRVVPLWMESGALRNYVRASHPAQRVHGGEGAFYVRLR